MELSQILLTAANALLPVVLLVLLGCWLSKMGIMSSAFASEGSRLTFRVFLPVSVFLNVYDIENFAEIQWDIVLYSSAMLLLTFGLGYLTTVAVTKEPRRRGALLQSTFCSNLAIVGIPLSSVLGGARGLAVTSIVSAFAFPIINILCVVSLSIFKDPAKREKVSAKAMIRPILTNPMIQAIAVGMLFLLARSVQIRLFGNIVFTVRDQLRFVYNTMNYLRTLTMPLALVVLGGMFDFSATKGLFKEIAVGTCWRVVLSPAIGIGLAVILSRYSGLIEFGVSEYPALIALLGTPAAVSSAVLAAQMDADEQLATQLVLWTSIFSIFTIFLTVCLLMAGGLLVL